MTGSLESIAGRALANDPDGLDGLLRAARPLVFRWALVRTADADDAEDITQSVLMRIHAKLDTWTGDARFTTWLYRITANAAAEHHRRNGIFRRLLDRLERMHEPAAARDPLASIEDERERRRVRLLLQGLSKAQRTIVDLVDLQGLSPSEAAEMLEMNPNTVRVHLLRGRRALRSRLLEESRDTRDPEQSTANRDITR